MANINNIKVGSSNPNAILFGKITVPESEELFKEFYTYISDAVGINIDGTEGDVCVYVDTPIYILRTTVTVDDVQYNALGFGLEPFEVEGKAAKKIEPFFFSADYTVNAQLQGDTAKKAYCIYNENVVGDCGTKSSYNTYFEEDMKPNGNGFPSISGSALQAGEYARNKNTNVNSNSPYMGLWYEWFEIWQMAMYGEIGTLDFCTETLFGYGSTNYSFSGINNTTTNTRTEFPAKTSSVKFISADGSNIFWGNFISQSLKVGTGGARRNIIQGISGADDYGFLPILIHNRIIDNVVKNKLTSYVDNEDAVFTSLGSSVVTNGSINVEDGTGMTAGQYYIKIWDVPNCKGIADGVQTAVIDIYVKLTIKDGVYYAYQETDLSGGIAIYKFSLPVYRGICWFKGAHLRVEGCNYVQVAPEGTSEFEYWEAANVGDAPVIRTDTGYYDDAAATGALSGMTKILDVANNRVWVKDMDYDASIHNETDSGAGQHTYECSYMYRNASWGAPSSILSDGRVLEGHSCVNNFSCGASIDTYAGRSVYASDALSRSNVSSAVALGGLLQTAS